MADADDGPDAEEEEEANAIYRANLDAETKAKMKRSFKLFDKDGNGKIDNAELKALLSRMGNQDTRILSDEDIQELINDFDEDADGKLDIDELVNAWTFITSASAVDETLQAQRQAAAAKMAGRKSMVDADGKAVS